MGIVTSGVLVDFPPMKNNPGENIKKERPKDVNIIKILEDNDYRILDLLCHGTLAGDTAAIAARGIVKILLQRGTNNAIMFIQRIFEERIRYYRTKSKDLSDITRDNGLVTMLLVAFEKEFGTEYLRDILTGPLKEIFANLGACEMDSQKIAKKDPSLTAAAVDQLKNENRKRLEDSCAVLFAHIFKSDNMVPESIKNLCAFLSKTIEQCEIEDSLNQLHAGSSEQEFSIINNRPIKRLGTTKPQPKENLAISEDPKPQILDQHFSVVSIDSELKNGFLFLNNSFSDTSNMASFDNTTKRNPGKSHLKDSFTFEEVIEQESTIKPNTNNSSIKNTRETDPLHATLIESPSNLKHGPIQGDDESKKNAIKVKDEKSSANDVQKGKNSNSNLIENDNKEPETLSSSSKANKNQIQADSEFQVEELNVVGTNSIGDNVKSPKVSDSGVEGSSNMAINHPDILPNVAADTNAAGIHSDAISGHDSQIFNNGIDNRKTRFAENTKDNEVAGNLEIQQENRGQKVVPPNEFVAQVNNDSISKKARLYLAHESGAFGNHASHSIDSQLSNLNFIGPLNSSASHATYASAGDLDSVRRDEAEKETDLQQSSNSVDSEVKESHSSIDTLRKSRVVNRFEPVVINNPITTKPYEKRKFEENLKSNNETAIKGEIDKRLERLTIVKHDTKGGQVFTPSSQKAKADSLNLNLNADSISAGADSVSISSSGSHDTISKVNIEKKAEAKSSENAEKNPTEATSSDHIPTSNFDLKSSPSENQRESEINWVGNLTIAEKVVGSFLFLRFIIPAITTPESAKIVLDNISVDSRRGLILCSKMTTSLCNDNEFGYKDVALIPCNKFLNPYRMLMKKFLMACSDPQYLCETAELESNTPVNKIRVRQRSMQNIKLQYLDSKRKNQRLSMEIQSPNSIQPGMTMKPESSTAKSEKISGSPNTRLLGLMKMEKSAVSMIKEKSAIALFDKKPKLTILSDPDVNALFYALANAITKIETDVHEKLKTMPDAEQKEVEIEFNMFKELLLKHYTIQSLKGLEPPNSANSGKPGSLERTNSWSKLKRKLVFWK